MSEQQYCVALLYLIKNTSNLEELIEHGCIGVLPSGCPAVLSLTDHEKDGSTSAQCPAAVCFW